MGQARRYVKKRQSFSCMRSCSFDLVGVGEMPSMCEIDSKFAGAFVSWGEGPCGRNQEELLPSSLFRAQNIQ